MCYAAMPVAILWRLHTKIKTVCCPSWSHHEAHPCPSDTFHTSFLRFRHSIELHRFWTSKMDDFFLPTQVPRKGWHNAILEACFLPFKPPWKQFDLAVPNVFGSCNWHLRCPNHQLTPCSPPIQKKRIIYFGLSPCPVTVTTRTITFLVGNPYKPSFVTVTGSTEHLLTNHDHRKGQKWRFQISL